jgi:hypothetical protein
MRCAPPHALTRLTLHVRPRRARAPAQIWTRQPEELPYDPLLLLLAEGLRETQHPHTYVTRTAFAELLQAPGGYEKARECCVDAWALCARA